MNGPAWLTLLLGAGLGACLTVLIHYYATWRPNAPMTRVSRPGPYYMAECLDCGIRYRNADPYDVQGWAYDHQTHEHGAR